MIRALTFLVALFPLAALAWHYGPGQSQLADYRVELLISQAESAAENQDWEQAVDLYEQSLSKLPENLSPKEQRQRREIVLAQAQAMVQAGQILEGEAQLQTLLEELQTARPPDPELLTAVRHELATTGYFVAWLMRLEGATSEEWKPEAELARQHFRLLAEQTEGPGEEPTAFHKNLEATIRLEQMDLSELKAKPLPKKCPNPSCCRNLSQRKRQQCQSRCQNPGDGKKKKDQQPDDARKEINEEKGAGLHQRAGTGS